MRSELPERIGVIEAIAEIAAKTHELPTALATRITVCGTIAKRFHRNGTEALLISASRNAASTLDLVARHALARDKLCVLAWIDTALKQGAKLAHKWAKGIAPPVPPIGTHHATILELPN